VSYESFQFPFIVFWLAISAKWLKEINPETELWKYTALAQAGNRDRRLSPTHPSTCNAMSIINNIYTDIGTITLT